MPRRTVDFNDEVFYRLKDLKRAGESWNGLGHRLANLAEAEREDTDPFGPRCSECGRLVQQWTTIDGDALCLDCADIDESAALPD